ncbi:hypothetical protein [Pseudarthrobacter sp. NKDBFgelt]|uniref:hypothetical protein n=1 Tax=Pseudarthrobacter sp. NKDBFgelt TaxID=3384443 RepID=UPI0038D4BC77
MEVQLSKANTADWAGLQEAAAAGAIHTVRVSFADRLGRWRGKRVPVGQFLRTGGALGFGNGLIVSDVQCDVIEETPFTNMSTGYPDMHLHPEPSDVFPVGWAAGEVYCFATPTDTDGTPLAVAAAAVLDNVVCRLAAEGISPLVQLDVSCRFMADQATLIDPSGEEARALVADAADALAASGIGVEGTGIDVEAGTAYIRLASLPPAEAARAAVVAGGALRELAARKGRTATFMTKIPACISAAELGLTISGMGVMDVDASKVTGLLAAARPLFQPSVNAFKAESPSAEANPSVGVRVRQVSAEADPYISIATALAAIGQSLKTAQESPAGAFELGAAAAAMSQTPWLKDWLGNVYVDNTIPLLLHEARQFQNTVTNWEINRYWSLA